MLSAAEKTRSTTVTLTASKIRLESFMLNYLRKYGGIFFGSGCRTALVMC